MKLPLQLNRLPRAHSCSFGLLVFAFSFSWSSDSASRAPSPRLQAESSTTSTQSQPGLSLGTALKEEKETNAEASLAGADRLRDEQRKESNEKAIEEYKKAADLWRATGNFQQAAVALRN